MGDGRKVYWTIPPREKAIRCGRLEPAKDFLKNAVARRRSHSYEPLASTIAIRRRPANRDAELEQALATILIVDIVHSTEKAARLGDSRWAQVMNHYSTYVTSVCTGAIILGVAGLLKGRRATTHWAFTDLLPLVGATHEKARVVQDGNVITAAGVSAGIDFAFTVAAEIAGETAARKIQLGIEYDPAPPFDSGNPDRAPAAIKSAVLAGGYDKSLVAYRAGIDRATRL